MSYRQLKAPCLILLLSTLVFSACLFRPNPVNGVRKFSRSEVYLSNAVRYRVGELPETWESNSSKARVAAYYNANSVSTIYSSAFCDKQFDDARLTELAQQLESGLEDRSPAKRVPVSIGKHEALQTQFTGKLDGVEVAVQAIVLKKNGCSFDFVLIQNAQSRVEALHDFQKFYQGFELLPPQQYFCPVKRWCS